MRTGWCAAFLLALAVAGAGCAKQKDDSPGGGGQVYSPTLKSAQELASRATLECTGRCNDGVGMLIGIRSEASYYISERCTTFLVAPDVLLTNGHCVPQELRGQGKSCAGQIWAIFAPTATTPLQRIECSEVLDSGDPLTGLDFALLRLSQAPGRTPLPLSFDGLPNRLVLDNIRVIPTGDDGLSGSIENQHCLVVQGERELPEFDHPLRQNATLESCYSRKGNSGSPFLDAQGAVRAILFAGLTNGIGRDRLTLAVNLACIPLPVWLGGRTPPTECHTSR